MRYAQIKDVLQKLAPDYHRKVSDYYQQMAECDVSPRVRLMLDYLIDHEQKRALALMTFCQTTSRNVLDFWLTGISINFPHPKAEALPETAMTDLDQLIFSAVNYKQGLINYFSDILENSKDKNIINLFLMLKTQEEKALKRMIRHAQGLADL